MIAALALAGAVGVDRTASGQTLLAHPLVAATFAGALGGDVALGAYAGVLLTMLSMPAVPVGQSTPQDWSSAAVVTGWLAARSDSAIDHGAALMLGVLAAMLGGSAIQSVRGLARKWMSEDGVLPAPDSLARRHLAMILVHALRGVAVVLPFLFFGERFRVSGRLAVACEWMWTLAPWVGLPLLLRGVVGGIPGRWLVVGCALALAAILGGKIG